MVTRQLQVERGTWKVRRSKTNVRTLCNTTNPRAVTTETHNTRLIDCQPVGAQFAAVNVFSVDNCTPLLVQRNNGSNFFNRSWAQFKVGFGDPSGNYWLGNDLLSQLTVNNRYKLKFDLQSRNTRNWYWAEYGTFIVWAETYSYMMWVSGYSGNGGVYADSFGSMNGAVFTTYDRDNERVPGVNGGGFWYYYQCNLCRVNGFHHNSTSGYFEWLSLSGGSQLQSTRMWLQCKQ